MKHIALLSLIITPLVQAEDWPTWRHDNRRSGVSGESVTPSGMSQKWVFTAKTRPQPAWHGTMQRDAWNNIARQKPARAYDKAFNIIAADGKIFFSSNSGNACVALTATNGQELWRKAVGGAVRIAPTYDNDKIYFGADDGKVYCVNADNGNFIWKHQGAADNKFITCDHKFMSRYPCRTGVLIENGKAWCGFGLLPWQDNYLKALNPTNGTPTVNKTITAADWYSFEGPMLASASKLFVLQGRVSPVYFNLADGNLQGRLQGGGGTFALLTPDDKLIHGPGHGNNTWAKDRTYHLQESNAANGSAITRHSRAHRVLVNGANRYYIIRDAVKCSAWVQTLPDPECLIMVGNTIFVGAKNTVVAYNATNGTEQKRFTVAGHVHALAFADGRLIASTSAGKIYAFK
mgnify:FL=1